MNMFEVEDCTDDWDKERKALFHILWSCGEIRENIDAIYDFEERVITGGIPEMSSSATALLTLAYSLFNGGPADVYSVFHPLGEEYIQVALEAIRIRFGSL